MSSEANRPERIFRLGDCHSQAILWRKKPELYRLVGSLCQDCAKKHFPRRRVCAYCRSRRLEDTQLSHWGKIISAQFWSAGAEPWRGYEDLLPQVFALIGRSDGVKLEAEIIDIPQELLRQELFEPGPEGLLETLAGNRVRMVFRRMRKFDNGNLTYGYKFVLDNNNFYT